MKNYQNNIEETINNLESKLSEKCSGIRVVHAKTDIPGMITPDDNSAYVHVYLLNIPGEVMLEVKNNAYDIWENYCKEAVSFFVYSPEETKEQFPAYATSNALSASYISAISATTNWVTDRIVPTSKHFKIAAQRLASQPLAGIMIDKSNAYHPLMTKTNNTTAADTQLALAA